MSPSVDRPQRRSGFAALIGWTNVGKSTLLNRLVGSKLSAVGDVAQTTRRRILGARTFGQRGQIVFVDTPGIHDPRHRMNRAMVAAARETTSSTDLAALVIDAVRGVGPGDRQVVALLPSERRRLAVLNKIDLVRAKARLLPLMAELSQQCGFEHVVPVSAATGEGCDELAELVLSLLPPGPPLFPEDFLTDQPQRVLAAEWIREKLLRETRQELPHATAVIIDEWRERPDGLLQIQATVLVERVSQRKIVIGRGGERLRRIGSAARLELEELLGQRVFLQLWVRVREHWRDDERTLRELGLAPR